MPGYLCWKLDIPTDDGHKILGPWLQALNEEGDNWLEELKVNINSNLFN